MFNYRAIRVCFPQRGDLNLKSCDFRNQSALSAEHAVLQALQRVFLVGWVSTVLSEANNSV